MQTISIKQPEQATYLMDEDGLFRCTHENAEVEPPCCSGRDSEGLPSCGCHGQYSVYCYDCNNDDMTDNDAENIIEGHIGNMEPWDE